MNTITLAGCRADALAGYLQALGLLRLVTRQADPSALLHWRQDTAVLSTSLDEAALAQWLVDAYEPSPIISPWNSGSGFAGNGKSIAAEHALESFRSSTEPRFAALRTAIRAADRVVETGRARGWEGGSLWAKEHKADVVRLCRNLLPDDALAWLDVAVTLTVDDLRFSPLTGTGGNFGRQELSATFLQRLALVAGPEAKRPRSLAWAQAALFGREDVPYLRETVGQYDPGRAGGILSTPDEKTDDSGFANPWALVLTLEGTLLFASALTRRNHAAPGSSALPFLTRTSAVGYSSAATGETVKGEQWIPLWPRPASLAEVEQLLGEGRVQWNGRPARTGLEFALAVGSLGVERGLSAFRRFVITERLGQNPLAISTGRLPVTQRAELAPLRQPHDWIQRLKRNALPAGVATAVRRVEQCIYDAAAGGGPQALQRFVIEFGRLHAAVGRSSVREQIAPFQAREPVDWLAVLPADDELWVAAGFASLRDTGWTGSDGSARGLLTRVQATGHWAELKWAERPRTGLELNAVTLVRALGQAHRLRTIPERAALRDGEEGPARSCYPRGQQLPLRLVQDYSLGLLDEQLIADYLSGLAALGCPPATTRPWQEAAPRLIHPMLAALLPFFSDEPLEVRLVGEQTEAFTLHPAARREWIPQLLASGPKSVAAEVLRWLRINGCPPVLGADDLTRMRIDGARLAGALMLRVSPRAREYCLRAVCAVTTVEQVKEGTPA